LTEVTYIPGQDSYIAQFYPDTNFGNSPALFISRYLQCCDIYRSLVQFDLCNLCKLIPITCDIEEAILELTIYRNEISCGSIDLKVFHLLNTWDEITVTWNNQPPVPATPDAIIPINAGFLGTISVDITDLVRDWHNGSIPNNGILLKGDETQNNLVGFFSKDSDNSSFWPKLHVKFCCPSNVTCDIQTDTANIYTAACIEPRNT